MGSPARAGLLIFVFGIMGFLMALIEGMAYDNGYLLTMYLSSADQLPGLQIVTIIMALLIGCVLAAVTQG